jgi:hypothetical protein
VLPTAAINSMAPNGISLMPGISLIFVLLPNFSIFLLHNKAILHQLHVPDLFNFLVSGK